MASRFTGQHCYEFLVGYVSVIVVNVMDDPGAVDVLKLVAGANEAGVREVISSDTFLSS